MIVHVVGARPNLMKAAAVVKHRPQDVVVHTGQHYDLELSDLAGFEPDFRLGVNTSSVAELLAALEQHFLLTLPDKVVVYGDVNSTLAAALAAAHLNVPVAHVEAGLRSFDLSMPEEVNRLAVDAVSSQWFTTEPSAVKNLSGAGDFVGNPMIDTLASLGVSRGDGGPAVVTLHRQGNVDDRDRAGRIVEALNKASTDHEIVAVLHPRSAYLAGELEFPSSGPLPYRSFVELVARAPFVVTDSGGVQEETCWLGVPCLTVRPNTERPVTVAVGGNRLVEPEGLAAALDGLPQRRAVPPLWDGRAGERIAGLL